MSKTLWLCRACKRHVYEIRAHEAARAMETEPATGPAADDEDALMSEIASSKESGATANLARFEEELARLRKARATKAKLYEAAEFFIAQFAENVAEQERERAAMLAEKDHVEWVTETLSAFLVGSGVEVETTGGDAPASGLASCVRTAMDQLKTLQASIFELNAELQRVLKRKEENSHARQARNRRFDHVAPMVVEGKVDETADKEKKVEGKENQVDETADKEKKDKEDEEDISKEEYALVVEEERLCGEISKKARLVDELAAVLALPPMRSRPVGTLRDSRSIETRMDLFVEHLDLFGPPEEIQKLLILYLSREAARLHHREGLIEKFIALKLEFGLSDKELSAVRDLLPFSAPTVKVVDQEIARRRETLGVRLRLHKTDEHGWGLSLGDVLKLQAQQHAARLGKGRHFSTLRVKLSYDGRARGSTFTVLLTACCVDLALQPQSPWACWPLALYGGNKADKWENKNGLKRYFGRYAAEIAELERIGIVLGGKRVRVRFFEVADLKAYWESFSIPQRGRRTHYCPVAGCRRCYRHGRGLRSVFGLPVTQFIPDVLHARLRAATSLVTQLHRRAKSHTGLWMVLLRALHAAGYPISVSMACAQPHEFKVFNMTGMIAKSLLERAPELYRAVAPHEENGGELTAAYGALLTALKHGGDPSEAAARIAALKESRKHEVGGYYFHIFVAHFGAIRQHGVLHLWENEGLENLHRQQKKIQTNNGGGRKAPGFVPETVARALEDDAAGQKKKRKKKEAKAEELCASEVQLLRDFGDDTESDFEDAEDAGFSCIEPGAAEPLEPDNTDDTDAFYARWAAVDDAEPAEEGRDCVLPSQSFWCHGQVHDETVHNEQESLFDVFGLKLTKFGTMVKAVVKVKPKKAKPKKAKAKTKARKAGKLALVPLVEAALAGTDSLTLSDAIEHVAAAHDVQYTAARSAYYRQKNALEAVAATAARPAPAPRAPTTKERAKAMEQFVMSGLSLDEALDKACAGSDASLDAVQRAFYRHRGSAMKAVHGNCLTTQQEDRCILAAVLALAALNFPPSAADVEEFATVIGLKFMKTYSSQWGRRWLKRKYKQGLLSCPRRGKAVSNGRMDHAQMLESCKRFAVELAREIALNGHLPATAFINADETLLLVTGNGVQTQRVTRRGAARVNVSVGAGGNTIGSMLVFVNAAGECLLRVLVLKKKDKDGLVDLADVVVPIAEVEGSQRRKVPTRIMYSKSGLIDEAMYFEIVKVFVDEWALHGIGADTKAPAPLWAYVFLDQLAVHRAREVIVYALKNNVHLWSLPRNTSHLTQPLDDVIFAAFKSTLRKLFEEKKTRRLKNAETVRYRELLLQSVWEACTVAFKPETVKKAFANVHLYPFDEAAFVAHCEASIRTSIKCDAAEEVARVAKGVVTMLTAEKKVAEEEDQAYAKVGRPSLRVLQLDVHRPGDLKRLSEQHDALLAELQRQKSEAKDARTAAVVKRKRDAAETAEAAKCHHVEKDGGAACTSKYRGGVTWFVCGICSTYKLCAKHNSERKRSQHAHTCDALPRRPAKRAREAKKSE